MRIEEPPLTWRTKIKNIILASSAESAIGLGYSLAANHFLEPNTPRIWSPLTTSTICMTVNLLLRLPHNYLSLKIIRGFFFFLMDMLTRALLVHEVGHVIAFRCLYDNSHPEIIITPPSGAYTQGNISELSSWGEQIGSERSQLVVSGAGTLIAMIWNYMSLIIAHAIPDTHLEIKSHIYFMALGDVLHHTIYALSAYQSCEGYSDFCDLEQGGFPPGAAAATILGSALLLLTLLSCCSKTKPDNSMATYSRRLLTFKSRNNLTETTTPMLDEPLLDERAPMSL